MTAILIGMLVDEGKLQWKLSVAEAPPEIPADSARRKSPSGIWSRIRVVLGSLRVSSCSKSDEIQLHR